MNAQELRENSIEELREEEKRIRNDIFETEFKHATRQLTDTASIGRMKKDLARVLTVIGQKQREAAASHG